MNKFVILLAVAAVVAVLPASANKHPHLKHHDCGCEGDLGSEGGDFGGHHHGGQPVHHGGQPVHHGHHSHHGHHGGHSGHPIHQGHLGHHGHHGGHGHLGHHGGHESDGYGDQWGHEEGGIDHPHHFPHHSDNNVDEGDFELPHHRPHHSPAHRPHHSRPFKGFNRHPKHGGHHPHGDEGFSGPVRAHESFSAGLEKSNRFKDHKSLSGKKGFLAGEKKTAEADFNHHTGDEDAAIHKNQVLNRNKVFMKDQTTGVNKVDGFRHRKDDSDSAHIGASDTKFIGAGASAKATHDQEFDQDTRANLRAEETVEAGQK